MGAAIDVSYFLAAALFILGLKRMSSPVTARGGIVWAGAGMVVATLITFLTPGMHNYGWMTLAIAIGGWYIGLNLEAISLKSVVPYKIVIWTGLSLICLTNLLTTVRYHAVLSESGGLSTHSDAIYDLSAWLARNAGGHVIAMDWGLAAAVGDAERHTREGAGFDRRRCSACLEPAAEIHQSRGDDASGGVDAALRAEAVGRRAQCGRSWIR